MILALRLLELKCRHNFTNNAYTDILDLIGGEGDSEKTEKTTLYLAKGKLNELVDIKLNYVDMCKDSCCAFTGIYVNDLTCRLCGLGIVFRTDRIESGFWRSDSDSTRLDSNDSKNYLA